MLDFCQPPEGAACASCGKPTSLRLVAMNYPDQEIGPGKKHLVAYVAPGDPRPFPLMMDMCGFCWRAVGSLISAHVYHEDAAVDPWKDWLRAYPPGVMVLLSNGRYRSSDDLLMDEELRKTLSPEDYEAHQRLVEKEGYRRKNKDGPSA